MFFERAFLREQFWNSFFEGAVLKEQFWNACLREQFIIITSGNWLKGLLINDYWLMWTLFFIKLFDTSKTFLICLNITLELLITGCNQARCVSRDTSLECMLPLEKSSVSLGKGWMGSIWWPLAWHDALSVAQVLHSHG